MLGISWGGGGRAALRRVPARPLPPAGAGRHGDRRADGAGPAVGARAHGDAAALPGPRLPGADRRRPLRRLGARSNPSRSRRRCTTATGSARRAGTCTSSPRAAGWTSVPFLPLLRQRTLILSGDDDPIIPLANARLMKLLIPNARLHVYHGGHLGLVTEAAELAPVVDAFLAAPVICLEVCHGRIRPDRRDRRRLLPDRAGSRHRRPPAPAPGQGVHGEVGPAGHQPLLDPGGIPVRPDGPACASSASRARPTPGTAAPAAAACWTA